MASGDFRKYAREICIEDGAQRGEPHLCGTVQDGELLGPSDLEENAMEVLTRFAAAVRNQVLDEARFVVGEMKLCVMHQDGIITQWISRGHTLEVLETMKLKQPSGEERTT